MDPNFSWIYLVFFLIIPLTRIIPRLIAKRRRESRTQEIQEKTMETNYESYSGRAQGGFTKPKSKNMLVLGEINQGAKTFENIQKNTGLDDKELDKILQNLENDGLLRVKQKQGLFGLKIELHPTDKGFKEYYS